MHPYVCEELLHVCMVLLGVLVWGGRDMRRQGSDSRTPAAGLTQRCRAA